MVAPADKAFCIIRSPTSGLARRVDLVAIPKDQWACGLLGWTGSKQFNRELRRLAQDKYGYILTSHNLSRRSEPYPGNIIPLTTEADLFNALGLEYRGPTERSA